MERYDYDGLLEVNSDLRNQLADAQATVEALTKERDAWKRALHSLTPGGSEYANDSKTCVNWVREARSRQHETIIESVKQRKELQAALDAEREKVAAVAKERDVQCTLKQNCIGMLEQEREKVKDFEAAAGAMSCKEIADKVAGYTQLQALVRALEESRDAWRASQECSEKAYMALVNQIPAERFDYDPVNVALLDGAKEQEIIGRKQIADLQAALDAEREKRTALLAEIDEGLTLSDNLLAIQTVTALYDKLAQLQALVRALPVLHAPIVVCLNGNWTVKSTDSPLKYSYIFESQQTAVAVCKLLRYRATLGATTPAGSTT